MKGGTIWWGLALLILSCWTSPAQEPSKPPKKVIGIRDLSIDPGVHALPLSHNQPELIRQELLETNTVRLLAQFGGISEAELAALDFKPRTDPKRANPYLVAGKISFSDKVAWKFSEQLFAYIVAREQGHTRACVMDALSNHVDLATISDRGLRAIATKHPLLPISWMRRANFGTMTNKAGTVVSRAVTTTMANGKATANETAVIPKEDELLHWTSYIHIDGEVGWLYVVTFKSDGSIYSVRNSKSDWKEFDARLSREIRVADAEALEEMKKDGTYGTPGSVHDLWHRKKAKLKAKGIEWRSPADLNPEMNYE